MKKIILLSDGTGNGAAKQHKTNVWRLYRALDLQGEDQIAIYDDGVGTEEFLPLKLLGGAFGWGLKRNVIELYKALCRTYDEGDKIYLFGFSRGAFTVRMLAGMVGARGLCRDVTDEKELHAVARKQFAAYRLRSGKGLLTLPIRRVLGRGTPKGETQAEIEFIGVWDTVEAYGFPVDEVAKVWDRLVLPLKFVKKDLPKNVRRACHALAVDEERLSFRPVLFDEAEEDEEAPRIDQVWFAGVHSDVGGGYPMEPLALVSLDWMISQVEARNGDSDGLRFLKRVRKDYWRRSDWHGKQHDSRSGLATYYRYKPRDIADLCKRNRIQRLKVHRGVLERIRRNVTPYAPAVLPRDCEVVSTRSGSEDVTKFPKFGVDAMEAALDTLFWRRWLYFALQWATVLGPAVFLSASSWRLEVSCRDWRAWLVGAALALLFWLKRKAPGATHTRAARAWAELKGRGVPDLRPHSSLTRRFRTFLKKRPWLDGVREGLVIALLVAGLLTAGAIAVSRPLFFIQSCCETLCRPTEALTVLTGERSFEFSIENPCFASGVTLKRGDVYRFEVKPAKWKDGSIKAGPDGFSHPKLLPFVPFRRHVTEPWLKLMGRVGPRGRAFAIGSGPLNYRAESDGELFLYVNDAVLGLPGDRRTLPYRWSRGRNEGTATVTVSPVEGSGTERGSAQEIP